jgi:hypothetical protein
MVTSEIRRGDARQNVTLESHLPGDAAEAIPEMTHAIEHASVDDYQMFLFATASEGGGDRVGVGVRLSLPVQVGDVLTVTSSSKDYLRRTGTAGVALSWLLAGPTFQTLDWYPTSGSLVIRDTSPLAFELDVAFRPETGDGPLAYIKGTAAWSVLRDRDCGM